MLQNLLCSGKKEPIDWPVLGEPPPNAAKLCVTHYPSKPGRPLCLREARPCVLPPVFPSCLRHSPMQGAFRDPAVHHHSADRRPPTRRHHDLHGALHYNLVSFPPALALMAVMLVETSWSQQGGLAFRPTSANGLLTLLILPG